MGERKGQIVMGFVLKEKYLDFYVVNIDKILPGLYYIVCKSGGMRGNIFKGRQIKKKKKATHLGHASPKFTCVVGSCVVYQGQLYKSLPEDTI
jgi:hypothetical protein